MYLGKVQEASSHPYLKACHMGSCSLPGFEILMLHGCEMWAPNPDNLQRLQGRSQHFKERGYQITKSCLVHDKYRSVVALKIDTVKVHFLPFQVKKRCKEATKLFSMSHCFKD